MTSKDTWKRTKVALGWALVVAVYVAAIAGGLLLARAITAEYFPGGLFWVLPATVVSVPVFIAGLHLRAVRSGHRQAGTLLVLLALWVPGSVAASFVHHFVYVIPHRIKDCHVYESPCSEVRRLEPPERF